MKPIDPLGFLIREQGSISLFSDVSAIEHKPRNTSFKVVPHTRHHAKLDSPCISYPKWNKKKLVYPNQLWYFFGDNTQEASALPYKL